MNDEYNPPYTVPTTPPALEPIKVLSTEEKNMAMFVHLSTFLGCVIPMANIIAPLIFWQIKKETMPYAAEHAKEALNFQVSLMILLFISFLLSFIGIGLIGIIALIIINLACTIIAAIKSNDGHHYRYPMTIRLIK